MEVDHDASSHSFQLINKTGKIPENGQSVSYVLIIKMGLAPHDLNMLASDRQIPRKETF